MARVRAHSNDPDYILNPASGRYVKRSGPTGRRLVQELTVDSVGYCSICMENDKKLRKFHDGKVEHSACHSCYSRCAQSNKCPFCRTRITTSLRLDNRPPTSTIQMTPVTQVYPINPDTPYVLSFADIIDLTRDQPSNMLTLLLHL
jgi:hypothetical protein